LKHIFFVTNSYISINYKLLIIISEVDDFGGGMLGIEKIYEGMLLGRGVRMEWKWASRRRMSVI
jgi:hypothetical protein